MKCGVAVAAMWVASTAHADVVVQIRCPAAAPPETAAALALELDAAVDATVAIDATPCDGAAPLQITIDAGGRRLGLALFGGVALHASVESGATVHSRAIYREHTDAQAPPGDDLAVTSGRYWSASVGLTLR